jgi:hypothetical protein
MMTATQPLGTRENPDIVVPESTLERGFHRMRRSDCAGAMKAMYNACPVVEFADLKPGSIVSHENGGSGYLSSTTYKIYRVVRHTPSGTQVALKPYPETYEVKLDRRTVRGKFRELSEETFAVLQVSHRMIVEEAIYRGLYIPPIVRREYPELFVDIPERFGFTAPHHYIRTTEAERVAESMFCGNFLRKPTTEKTVLGWIDSAHGKIQEMADYAIRKAATNPDVSEDFDRYTTEFQDNIDFYRWLLPLVSERGVFYIESKPEETES